MHVKVGKWLVPRGSGGRVKTIVPLPLQNRQLVTVGLQDGDFTVTWDHQLPFSHNSTWKLGQAYELSELLTVATFSTKHGPGDVGDAGTVAPAKLTPEKPPLLSSKEVQVMQLELEDPGLVFFVSTNGPDGPFVGIFGALRNRIFIVKLKRRAPELYQALRSSEVLRRCQEAVRLCSL